MNPLLTGLARMSHSRRGIWTLSIVLVVTGLLSAAVTARIFAPQRDAHFEALIMELLSDAGPTLRPSLIILALTGGGIWALIFLHFFPKGQLRRHFWLIPAALILGWLSTIPTVHSGRWMDTWSGLAEDPEDFLNSLFFHTFSVGLREEGLKLLFFLPLLFGLRRAETLLPALIFGALTGIGFAMAENLLYYQMSFGGGVAVTRHTSATFLHATLTGVNAAAAFRVMRRPRRYTQDAVLLFAITVFLHGIYNALLTAPIPGLGDMSEFSIAALAGCAFLFFQEIPPDPRRHTFSLTACFFWGYGLMILLELILTTVYTPFREAVRGVGHSALAALFIAFVFLHHIREPLGD